MWSKSLEILNPYHALVETANAAEKSESESNNPCCCSSKGNDFIPINQTAKYSSIEIAINRQGMLRVRSFDAHGKLDAQDSITIHHCPLCGRRF